MRSLSILVLAVLFALYHDAAQAHIFEDDKLAFSVGSARTDPNAPDERVLLILHFSNGTGNAATLRGLWVEGHGDVGIEKLREFLGLKSWQEVKFLRLDPGKELNVAPPTYRVSVPITAWQSESFRIFADFGPLGRIAPQAPEPFRPLDDAIRQ